jgi:hypothetical protein
MRSIRLRVFVGALLLSPLSCAHYHITPQNVAPSTQPVSVTEAAYLWGLVQPNDIVPPNCPKKVPLAEVTAETNFGYFLIQLVTLDIVDIQTIEWRCAALPGSRDTNVLSLNSASAAR